MSSLAKPGLSRQGAYVDPGPRLANLTPSPGNLSPLRTVIGFARECDLPAMRDLLLAHGAAESEEDRKRYLQREASIAFDPEYMRNFHRSETI